MDYLNEYENIITKARSKNRIKGQGIYYENHHIIPKCWCVSDLEYMIRDSNNQVLLLGREHFMAHYYLAKEFGEKMLYAFWAMCNLKREYQERDFENEIENFAELYEEIKIKLSKEVSKQHKNRIVSKETRKKMSIGTKKRPPVSEETKKKLSIAAKKRIILCGNGMQGKHHSEETRKKISLARMGKKSPMRGRRHTEESKLKMRIIAKNRPPVSEETKKKLSDSARGRRHTEESKLKMRIIAKNRPPVSEETKKKLSIRAKERKDKPMQGKHHSEETRKKMSISQKNIKKIKCIYCDIICNKGMINRWHNDNCKRRI